MSASHSQPMGARGWEPDFGTMNTNLGAGITAGWKHRSCGAACGLCGVVEGNSGSNLTQSQTMKTPISKLRRLAAQYGLRSVRIGRKTHLYVLFSSGAMLELEFSKPEREALKYGLDVVYRAGKMKPRHMDLFVRS